MRDDVLAEKKLLDESSLLTNFVMDHWVHVCGIFFFVPYIFLDY